jgi:hypothetical protein
MARRIKIAVAGRFLKGAGMASCDQGGGSPIGLDIGMHLIAKPLT